MDVSCDKGLKRMSYRDLPESDRCCEWIVTTDLVLNHKVKDLEIRVWVPASAQLTLESIAIEPVQRALLVAKDKLAAVESTLIEVANSSELLAALTATVLPPRKKNKKSKRR